MSRSKKDRRRSPLEHQDIGLLGAAFNLPTRRNIELAERRAAAAAAGQAPHQVKVTYQGGHISASEVSSSSDDDGSEDDSDSALLKVQRWQQRDDSHMRQTEKPAARQPQPSSRASKCKKLTKSKSVSTSSVKALSPPVAPLVSPSATFPSLKSSRIATPVVGPRHLQLYHQPQAPFALTTIPVAPPAQILQCAPPAIALPRPVSAPLKARSQPPGIVAQQIQKIQGEIDSKVAMLSRDASDRTLRDELTALQNQLNSTLNTVLGAKNTNSRQPSTEEKNRTTFKEKLHPESSHVRKGRRDESPEHNPRHNLCSGCGSVRSPKFHAKHPILQGDKPALNYCKSCQGAAKKGGRRLLERYHFCFGCGIVRSKKFQRQNPRHETDGFAIPNYCGKCTQEIQSIGDIAEASAVMDFGSDFSDDEEESLGNCSIAVQAQSDITPEAASPQTQSEFSFDSVEVSHSPSNSITSDKPSGKSRGIRNAKRRLGVEPLNLTQSPSLLLSPGTPYYPERRSGSAQRRAQRSPLASLSGSGNFGRIGAESTPTRAYRAPYVEDVLSPETQHPLSLRERPSKHSFERVSAPRRDKKRQSCGVGRETLQDGPGSISKNVKSKENPEVHFSGYLSGEEPSDEDANDPDTTQSDGAHERQAHARDGPPAVQAEKSRSIFQKSHQEPLETFDFKGPTDLAGSAAIREQHEEHPDTSRFWKGAFARRERGEAGAWANHITSPDTERQASPSSPSASSSSSFAAQHPPRSTPSPPGATKYPPSIQEPYIAPVTDIQDENPPLRTSKGAFGSSAFMSSPFFNQGMNFTENRSSSPPGQKRGQNPSHRRSDFSGAKPGESPFGSTSSFAGFGCKFDPECFAVRDDDEPFFHGYGDFPHLSGGSSSSFMHPNSYKTYCPSTNPYYVPRKSTFADLPPHSGFPRRSCRSRAGDRSSDSKARASRRGTPEWIPEPIIEEPSSPMGSPVPCAMLLGEQAFSVEAAMGIHANRLEFNHSGSESPVPPLSEASTESTELDVLEISDME